MSQASNFGGRQPWLEAELARQLGPVAAPEALWNRIALAPQEPVRHPRAEPVWLLWPAIAAIFVLACAGLLWELAQARGPMRDTTQLTPRELRMLASTTRGFDFASDNPAALRRWVKSNTGIDIEMPAAPSGTVRLLGARLATVRGMLIASISYKVGDDAATLFVSRRLGAGWRLAAAKHVFAKSEPDLVTWNMGRQVYTIAFAGTGDQRGACKLCHVM